MPRRLPLHDPEKELELVLGAVIHVADDDVAINDPEQLRVACRGMIRQRRQWELPPKRYFLVSCPNDDETFIVSAGPRGGSWVGRCPTCGRKGDEKPKASVVEEVVDLESEGEQ
jgi:hypothetical protein